MARVDKNAGSLTVLTTGPSGVKCCGRGRCCENNPGWFAPGEVEAAAEFLKLTPEAFVNKFLVLGSVRLTGEVGQPVVEAYVPTKVDAKGEPLEATGKRPSRAYQFMTGPCVFYQNRRCAIHPVRPMECRGYFCEQDESLNISHEQIGKLWYDAWRAAQRPPET